MEPTKHSAAKLHPDDFNGEIVLPDIVKELNSYKDFSGTSPKFKDEVAHLDRLKSALFPSIEGYVPAGSFHHRRVLDNYRRYGSEAKVKNIGLYQQNPDNEAAKFGLLHTLRNHVNGGVPFSSLFSNEEGVFKVPFEKSLVSSDIDGVEFDPNRFPTYEKGRKNDFGFQKLNSKNTVFFKNAEELETHFTPFFNHFSSVREKSIPELAKLYNELSGSERFDVTQDFTVFDDESSFPLIVEMMGDGLVQLDPFNLFFRSADWKEKANEKAKQSEAKLNSVIENKGISDPDGFDYWKKELFNNELDPAPQLVRSTLIASITPLILENLSEQDKESISKLVGAAARFGINVDPEGNPLEHGISVDATGRGVLDTFGSATSVETVHRFIDEQGSMFFDAAAEESTYQREAENLTSKINKLLQNMMKNRDGVAMRGLPVGEEGILGGATAADVMRKYAIAERFSSLGNGTGIQGASMGEMEGVLNLLAQLFETQNRAALQGYDVGDFDALSKPFYTDGSGNQFVLNFSKQTGVLDISTDFMNEMGFSKKDPVYSMVKDLANQGSRWAVLHGKNGDRVTPLLQVLAMGLDNPEGKSLPLRVKEIKIADTDINVQRQLEEISPNFKLFGKPIRQYFHGTQSTIPVEENSTFELTEKGADLAAAASNPKLDKDKDGVVTSQERKNTK